MKLGNANVLKIFILSFIFGLLFYGNLYPQTPRPIPEFLWLDSKGKAVSSNSLKGKPLLILFSPSITGWTIQRQIRQIQSYFDKLASEKTICLLALDSIPNKIPSNVPFVLIGNTSDLRQKLGIQSKFAIAVVGHDGNVDLLTHRRQSAQRILDIIRNSQVFQQALRRP